MERRCFVGIVLAAGLVGVAGCDASPPDRSRLAEGSEAVVFDAGRESIRAETNKHEGIGGEDWRPISVGFRVMVVRDDGPESDPSRTVSIAVPDGRIKGHIVRVPRANLRAH